MKYRIKNVPAHSLHFDSYGNLEFGSNIKNYVGEEAYNLFRQTIFETFLDMPQYNFQGQIFKCLLMLELEQENSNEIHVYMQEIILKFTITEISLISRLKCTGNIEEHLYTQSSKSVLMAKYFSSSNNSVKKYIFVQRFKDTRYEQFSWGKDSFQKLIATWRHDFFVENQLYSIGGMPHVLNVWMYECCSEVNSTIAEHVGNVIPRIFNWKVVEIKVKYEKCMTGMFNKFVYNNLRSTVEEVQRLDLPMIDGVELNIDESTFLHDTSPDRSGKRNAIDIHTHLDTGHQGFENFSTVPPPKILRK
ncbi:hypothetical protein P3S67_001859 [Capsicum chacoense]